MRLAKKKLKDLIRQVILAIMIYLLGFVTCTWISNHSESAFYYIGTLSENQISQNMWHLNYDYNENEEIFYFWSESDDVRIRTEGNVIHIEAKSATKSRLHVIKISNNKRISLNGTLVFQ